MRAENPYAGILHTSVEVLLGATVLFFAWIVAAFEGGMLVFAITPLSALFFVVAEICLIGPMTSRRGWDLLREAAGTFIVLCPIAYAALEGFVIFDVGVLGRAVGLPSAA